jgi:mannose-6-phosphate isomerase-like protein (cupin superfamily)
MRTPLVTFNIESLAAELNKSIPWDAAQLLQVDNGIFQIALFNGVFDYHTHAEDKFFIVYKGSLTFYVKNEGVEEEYKLAPGDGLIIPANMERRRIAENGTLVLTFDTGNHSHGSGPGQHQHTF